MAASIEHRDRSEVRRLATVSLELAKVLDPIKVYDPHGDDFALAGGGTLWALSQLGKKIEVDNITDGRHGNSTRQEKATIVRDRQKEIIKGYSQLGIPRANIRFFRYPDSGLDPYLDAETYHWRTPKLGLYARLISGLRKLAPKTIFIPHKDDWHEDHTNVFRACAYAIRQAQNPNAFGDLGPAIRIEQVFVYGVWNELAGATHAFELDSKTQEIKRTALRAFRTQETVINRIAPGTEALETFLEVPGMITRF